MTPALSRSRPVPSSSPSAPSSLQTSVAADRAEATTRGGSQLHQGQEPRTLGTPLLPSAPTSLCSALSQEPGVATLTLSSLLWLLQKPVQRAQAASHATDARHRPHVLIQAPGARRLLQYFAFWLSIPSLKSKVLRRAFPASVI